jgi:hypothetical protein
MFINLLFDLCYPFILLIDTKTIHRAPKKNATLNTTNFSHTQSHFGEEQDDTLDEFPAQQSEDNRDHRNKKVADHLAATPNQSGDAVSGDEVSDLDSSHPDYGMLKKARSSEYFTSTFITCPLLVVFRASKTNSKF